MKVRIPKHLYQASPTSPVWKLFDVNERSFGYGGTKCEVHLDGALPEGGRSLVALCETHKKLKGLTGLRNDLRVWDKAVSGLSKGEVPKSVKQFAVLLTELLRVTPGHRVYEHDSRVEGRWHAYYVEKVVYHPASGSGDRYSPPYVSVHLRWHDIVGVQKSTRSFHVRDIANKTVEAAMLASGMYPETPELRKHYLERLAHFDSLNGKIGLQCEIRGLGVELFEKDDDRRWYRTAHVRLHTEDGPGRVLIDAVSETRDSDSTKTDKLDVWFWVGGELAQKAHVAALSDAVPPEDEEDETEDEEPVAVTPAVPQPSPEDSIEVPWHSDLYVFDLIRHRRFIVHADDLTKYVYNTALGEKLVLPSEVQVFLNLLTRYSGSFTDIIGGKGSGLAVLCAGPPGCGKTLCAQVYSEVLSRPLYSIQASQLGIKPAELETELTKAFTRAKRWNAILLVDEADVYVAKRGTDLVQNAIVGVFLRVMEYYDGILWMTTNRADLVDDAIASRCVARIDFHPPEPVGQIKLWMVLGEVLGVNVPEQSAQALVKAFPKLSGRDIKNLLKLVKMTSPDLSKPLGVDSVKFVRKFKPTGDIS